MLIGLEIMGGLIYLLLAGDLLVRGSVSLARRLRMPPALVGLTVVAFGTSAPELFVSLGAAYQGHADMAVGNVVGSNIANVLLVLGLPALIIPTGPTSTSNRTDVIWMAGATALFVAICYLGEFNGMTGLLLLAGLAGMLAHSISRARGSDHEVEEHEMDQALGLPVRRRMITLFLFLGAVGLPLGAYLMVDGAAQLAAALGVTDGVIGLSVVAFGTSLPELATTVAAALRRHADVAVGNVLGSNLFNIFAIMGTVSIAAPHAIQAPAAFLQLDLLVMVAAAGLLAGLALRGGAVTRATGSLLILAYLVYMVVLFSQGPMRAAAA